MIKTRRVEQGWVSGATADWVLGATASIGCSSAQMLRQSGIRWSGENVSIFNKPLLATEFTPVLQACLKELATHARGADAHIAAFDYSNLLTSCVINCPTLHAAISQTQLFIGAVQGPLATAQLNTSPGAASFSLSCPPGADTMAGLVVDFFELAFYCKLFSWLIGEPLRGRIALAHAPVAKAAVLKEILDCEIHFGSRVNCLTFEAKMLERPLCLGHAELEQLLKTCAIALLPLPGQRISDRLEMLIRRALETNAPIPYADQIARRYGRSGPTLRRQLVQEGASFRSLLNKCRLERAAQLLGDTNLTIEQIGHRLAFSSASGFSRAFKGWTGVAPAAYRNLCTCASPNTSADQRTAGTQIVRRGSPARLALAPKSPTG